MSKELWSPFPRCKSSHLTLKKSCADEIAALSPAERVKLEALKKVQWELLEKEAVYHRQAFAIESEFQAQLQELHDKRCSVVNGTMNDPDGVAKYWLSVFQKIPLVSEMINRNDEPVLETLKDLRCTLKEVPQYSFVLEFHFSPNDYFTNEILTKEYLMRCSPDPQRMVQYNGMEVYDSIGCDIAWKAEARHRRRLFCLNESTGDCREVPETSFFDFFATKKFAQLDPTIGNDILEADFEIGCFLKEHVIPKATLIFTKQLEYDDTEVINLEDLVAAKLATSVTSSDEGDSDE